MSAQKSPCSLSPSPVVGAVLASGKGAPLCGMSSLATPERPLRPPPRPAPPPPAVARSTRSGRSRSGRRSAGSSRSGSSNRRCDGSCRKTRSPRSERLDRCSRSVRSARSARGSCRSCQSPSVPFRSATSPRLSPRCSNRSNRSGLSPRSLKRPPRSLRSARGTCIMEPTVRGVGPARPLSFGLLSEVSPARCKNQGPTPGLLESSTGGNFSDLSRPAVGPQLGSRPPSASSLVARLCRVGREAPRECRPGCTSGMACAWPPAETAPRLLPSLAAPTPAPAPLLLPALVPAPPLPAEAAAAAALPLAPALALAMALLLEAVMSPKAARWLSLMKPWTYGRASKALTTGRFVGSLYSKHFTNSARPVLYSSGTAFCSDVQIIKAIAGKFPAWNGTFKQVSSYSTTPRDQMSAFMPYGLFLQISGERYEGVPTVEFACPIVPSIIFAMPKSPNLIVHSLRSWASPTMKMLAGFRSRCRIFFEWM
mmetsp:Transcript_87172/g.281555  ORF Transcript_87172/g.281555 Transcript_87172/m.281555 type:complete len:482 (+) Transcript_87172:1408-2853(+)